MENSIVLSLKSNVDRRSFLYQFYFNPVSYFEQRLYREDVLSEAAEYTFRVLSDSSMDELFVFFDEHRDDIHSIDTGNIPIFSSLSDVDRVPLIVSANPGCDFEMVGYHFNKDGSPESCRKYGETHYKTAALLGLTAMQPQCEVTYLGCRYVGLTETEKSVIRPRLVLLIPIVQKYVVMNLHGVVPGMNLLRNYLTESSAKRRRSSVKQLLRDVYRAAGDASVVEQNFDWK